MPADEEKGKIKFLDQEKIRAVVFCHVLLLPGCTVLRGRYACWPYDSLKRGKKVERREMGGGGKNLV